MFFFTNGLIWQEFPHFYGRKIHQNFPGIPESFPGKQEIWKCPVFTYIHTSRDLPSNRSHTSRGMRWGPLGVGVVSRPKGATLVPVGIPCCDEPDPSL